MDTKHATTRFSAARRQRGLTLIEAVIVMAVTAIIATVAAPSLAAFIDGRRLEGTAIRLAADVHFVRSAALARNEALRLSFQSNAAFSCWTVHTGAAAQCRCSDSGPAVCASGAREIKTVILPATGRVSVASNVGSIVFDPMHGTSTPTGTLRLLDTHGRAIHHVVNVMGRVHSCSPGAEMAGYRAC